MTLPRDTDGPKVHDRVMVGGREFEIRAIIAEEKSLIVAEVGEGPPGRRLWILRNAELTPLREGVWDAFRYAAFELAEERDAGENEEV